VTGHGLSLMGGMEGGSSSCPLFMDEKVLKEIDPTKNWVVDRTDRRIDYDLTVIREMEKPRLVVITVPSIFRHIAGRALRRLYPEIAPYTKVNTQSLRWDPNPYEFAAGYWRCSPNVVLEIAETAFHQYFRFFVDEAKESPASLHEAFLGALHEESRGAACNVSWQDAFDDEEVEEEGIVGSDVGGEVSSLGETGMTLEEFLSFYPPATALAFRRIIHMVDVIADNPGSGMHFSALLAGPPGTGKSLFATLLAQYAIEKKRALVVFSSGVTGIDFVYEAIKMFPLILFIFDECEFLVQDREEQPTRELIHLLQLLDGYAYRSYASWGMIFTTNRPHAVDPAFLRPVRLDELVEVLPLQDGHLGRKVFEYHCRRLGVEPPEGIDEKYFEGRTHAECAALAHKISRMAKFGGSVSAEDVKALLRDMAKWSRPRRLKGVLSTGEEKAGF
jgi:hypothetical protein